MRSLSILIVEDAPPFAEVLVTGLRDAGHRPVSALSGRDAIAALGRERFDLVITDVIMPEPDGFEVIETTRRLQPDTRIIAMSGGGKLYSAAACLEAAENSGIDAVLLKPFSLDVLFRKIGELFPD